MTKFMEKAVIMDCQAIKRSLTRIAHEIIENNKNINDVVLVGIRTRGVPLAERLVAEIAKIEGISVPVGVLDITLYRDDLSTLAYQPIVHETKIDLDINGKKLYLLMMYYLLAVLLGQHLMP